MPLPVYSVVVFKWASALEAQRCDEQQQVSHRTRMTTAPLCHYKRALVHDIFIYSTRKTVVRKHNDLTGPCSCKRGGQRGGRGLSAICPLLRGRLMSVS